jgi:hypothetical protein
MLTVLGHRISTCSLAASLRAISQERLLVHLHYLIYIPVRIKCICILQRPVTLQTLREHETPMFTSWMKLMTLMVSAHLVSAQANYSEVSSIYTGDVIKT